MLQTDEEILETLKEQEDLFEKYNTDSDIIQMFVEKFHSMLPSLPDLPSVNFEGVSTTLQSLWQRSEDSEENSMLSTTIQTGIAITVSAGLLYMLGRKLNNMYINKTSPDRALTFIRLYVDSQRKKS